MVTSDIIKKLKQQHPSLSSSQIQYIVSIIIETISSSLINGKPVELRDFGRWNLRTLPAKYNARNPKTGKKIYVPSKKKVLFTMSKHLKSVIN